MNRKKHAKIKAGDVFFNTRGEEIVVLQYDNCNNVIVQFQDSFGYTKTTNSAYLREGWVKNPYFRSVYGVGYFGVGDFKSRRGHENEVLYNRWRHMLYRAYSDEYKSKNPTYENITVCEDWLNLQNFAKWYSNQPNAGRRGFDLDKDLIVLGNKEYGPEVCSFVPCQINSLLNDCGRASGKLPRGVCVNNKGFSAQVSINGERKRFGTYKTPEEAHEVYKMEKEKQVKIVAERYKSELHPKVYENLMDWRVCSG